MPDAPHPPAVVLLSGGLDSTTTLAVARDRGFACHTIAVDYGQRHRIELESAARIARTLGAASHRVVSLDLRAIGGSALTDDIAVPKDAGDSHGIPVTYVPARNLVLLGVALGLAETVGAFDLFIGANEVDYSGYPDCRPAFLEAFAHTANLATKAGVEALERGAGEQFRVHAPLIRMPKADIIRLAQSLGVDLGATHSCYDPKPGGLACGRCDSCRIRARGFQDAGVPDPTRYG